MVFCMALPRFASIRSNIHPKNYLRYTPEEGELHGVLQFTGEEIMSPYSKFEIEKAGNANGFVHIRCCYNNKYWVAEPSSDSYIVAATANEPNEDQSQLSCTLFEPVIVSISSKNTNTIRFRHVQLRQYLSLVTSSTRDRALFAQSSSSAKSDGLDVFSIVDWDSILILPKNIMLSGNNGYLGAYTLGSVNYLQFAATTDHADPKVWNEVFTNEDGSVRIKNNYIGKFWRRAGTSNWDWILVDSDDTTTNDLDTLFSPVRIEDNVIGLLSLGNNNFCKRFSVNQMISCLAAATTDLSDRETRLVVEEYVSSRKINSVDFRIGDARIYDKQIISLATLSAANDTQVSQTVTASIGHNETISSTWNNSISLKLGVTADLESDIPKMVGESITIVLDDQFVGAYEWGEIVSKETEAETKRTITVPPMTKITANLLGTQCSYDIPFSYTQSDTLMNGAEVTYNLDDGLYTGTNFVNYSFEIKQENL